MARANWTRRSFLGASAKLVGVPIVTGAFSNIALAKAPLLGAWQPKNYRFKLGGFEITLISDSEACIDVPYPIIGKNGSEE